jgi:hypothetical protein
MEPFKLLLEFLKKNYLLLEPSGSSGDSGKIIKYELMPRDYLSFCDHEFENDLDTIESKINIISNLKRAFDCEISIFFEFLNLSAKIRDKNLGINAKLNFINQIGIFPKRSMVKIENIRNKIEHEYKCPELGELEVYYDLIYVFILIIEKQIALMQSLSEIEETLGDDLKNEAYGYFKIGYNFEETEIYSVFRNTKDRANGKYAISIDKDPEEFGRALHLFFIILQNEWKVNDEFTLSEIGKI